MSTTPSSVEFRALDTTVRCGPRDNNDNNDDNNQDRDRDRESGVALAERPKTKKPPLYRVLMHNDDYTTKEFVVMVLQDVFHRNEGEAIRIMTHVHNSGVGTAGVYTREVAETKIHRTMDLAQAYEFPLQLSMEPSD